MKITVKKINYCTPCSSKKTKDRQLHVQIFLNLFASDFVFCFFFGGALAGRFCLLAAAFFVNLLLFCCCCGRLNFLGVFRIGLGHNEAQTFTQKS